MKVGTGSSKVVTKEVNWIKQKNIEDKGSGKYWKGKIRNPSTKINYK